TSAADIPRRAAMSRRLSSEIQPRCRCTILKASMQTASRFGYPAPSPAISLISSALSMVGFLPVDVPQDEVKASEDDDQIRDHQAAAKERKRLDVGEGGRSYRGRGR